MKHKISLLLLLSLFFGNACVYANHIFGGELLYTNISGNTYRVTLTFYGDCASSAFPNLYTDTPLLHIYNGQDLYTDALLMPDIVGVEVSPVCPSQLSQTSCNGGMLPGVKKFSFVTTVTLSGPSANWRFIITGLMGFTNGVPNYAGRNINITNINQSMNSGTSTIIYLETTLNNINGPNNSPQYTTVPTPFYCDNIPESYNQGAVDPDGDSLVFSLVPGLDSVADPTPNNPNAFSSVPVIYNSGFSATAPLAAVPGSFSFNVLNGQLNFTPNIVQDALVVELVSEYRNGVLVGSSKRELTFIVLDNCQAPPATAAIVTGSISGGEIDSNNVLYVCEGTPNVAFNIKVASSSNDSVTVTTNSTLPNSTIAVLNNHTDTPVINFVWNTATVKAGVYNFFATLVNNHCPLSSTQTYAYTIYVVKPNTDTAIQLGATGCVHAARVEYNFSDGLLPRTVSVLQAGDTLNTFTDSTGNIQDSLRAGKYIIVVSSPHLDCPTFYNFTVVDSGALPAPYNYGFDNCLNAKPDSIQFLPFAGASVEWHNLNGALLPGSPTPDNSKVGQQKWYVIQTYNVCVSYADTVTVTINNLPNIQILTSNAPLCLDNKIYFIASGGEDYKWASTANKLFTDTGGTYTNVLLPDTYTVTAHDTNGCFNSDSLKIDNIERCCLLSYPNTFTPNKDNINDKYHVVVYGNTDAFELAIYNRWGQRVFHSFHPEDGWDGNFGGQPCELGTYYYLVRSHCVTGHSEEHKGEIVLLR